jgi:hypothetical protein
MTVLNALALVLYLALGSLAGAQDKRVTDLPPATAPLAGAELLYCVQGSLDKKCTAAQVGNAAMLGGTTLSNVTIPSWLSTYAYGEAGNVPLISISRSGQVAATFASRTSDQGAPPSSAASIPNLDFGFNDVRGGYHAWSRYDECRRLAVAQTVSGPNATVTGVGDCLSHEIDITEFGTAGSTDPYSGFFQQTSQALALASGGNCTGTSCLSGYDVNGNQTRGAAQTASRAVGIYNNGAGYYTGIEVGYNALSGADGKTFGQFAPVIKMPMSYGFEWDYCNNTTSYPANCTFGQVGFRIISQVSSSASQSQLVADNSGIGMQDPTGVRWFTAQNNHISGPQVSQQPTGLTCGSGPSIAATANDTHGTITAGTGTFTACSITWKAGRTNTPDCVVSSPTGAAFTSYTATSSGLTITNSGNIAASAKFSYVCMGL